MSKFLKIFMLVALAAACSQEPETKPTTPLIIKTVNGDIRVWGSLTDAEKLLPAASFARCNSCFLVNLAYVDKVEGSDLYIGTDVLAKEPPSASNPLLSAPNTIITPHMAWASVRSRQNIINLMAENIRRWRDGTPINVVNGVGKKKA